MKNVIKITMVILGTLIGAGFASGREIYLFFNTYGKLGLIGIIIYGILTILTIEEILLISKNKNIENYNKLLNQINNNYPKINKMINLIVNCFLLISFFIMISAFSSYLKENYNIETYISSSIFVLFCYITFKTSIKGIIKVNSLIVPLLLLFILVLGIKNIPYLLEYKNCFYVEAEGIYGGFIISSLIYTSYNNIVLIPVLVTLKDSLKSKKEIKNVALLSGFFITLLALIIYGLLVKGGDLATKFQLPLLEINKDFGINYKYAYEIIIIFSVFTSAISMGYSFLKNISKDEPINNKNLVLISIGGIIISNIEFSKLVAILYPLFGLLGLIQFYYVFENKFKLKKIKRIR